MFLELYFGRNFFFFILCGIVSTEAENMTKWGVYLYMLGNYC